MLIMAPICWIFLLLIAATGVHVDTKQCELPFTYKGRESYTCTRKGSILNKYWCSTTEVYSDSYIDCSDTSEAEVGVYVMLDGKTQQITHQTGTIISHRGYPQEYYPINMDSQLKIRVTGVLFLSLEVNQFNLEKRYSTGCYDYLQITDNTGNRQYCGNEISIGKSSRVVPNGQISFRFKTDSHTENFGFRLQFKYYVLVTITTAATTTTSSATVTSTTLTTTSTTTTPTTTTSQITTTPTTATSMTPSSPTTASFTTEHTTKPDKQTTHDSQLVTTNRKPATTHTVMIPSANGPTQPTTKPPKNKLTNENNLAQSYNKDQKGDNSTALGAGIGVSVAVTLIVVAVVVFILLRQRWGIQTHVPDGEPPHRSTNESDDGDTLQVRMSALPHDSDDYYSMPNVGSNQTYQALSTAHTNAGYHHYDRVEQVQTDEGLYLYEVANRAGGDDHVYISPEEINPRNGILGRSENKD